MTHSSNVKIHLKFKNYMLRLSGILHKHATIYEQSDQCYPEGAEALLIIDVDEERFEDKVILATEINEESKDVYLNYLDEYINERK